MWACSPGHTASPSAADESWAPAPGTHVPVVVCSVAVTAEHPAGGLRRWELVLRPFRRPECRPCSFRPLPAPGGPGVLGLWLHPLPFLPHLRLAFSPHPRVVPGGHQPLGVRAILPHCDLTHTHLRWPCFRSYPELERQRVSLRGHSSTYGTFPQASQHQHCFVPRGAQRGTEMLSQVSAGAPNTRRGPQPPKHGSPALLCPLPRG